jgi:ABC-type sugar transport system permease subunit
LSVAGLPARAARPRGLRRFERPAPAPYGLLLPALAVFAFVWLVPFGRAITLSLQRADGSSTEWVGLDNYRHVLASPLFKDSLEAGLLLVVLIVVPMTIGSFAMAVLLDRTRDRSRAIIITALLLPFIVAPSFVAIVFRSAFASNGDINGVLSGLGLPTVPWLTTPMGARVAVSAMALWEYFGFNVVLVYAALQRLPRDLFEAATLDGASELTMIRRISLPLTVPILLFVSVTTTFSAFNLFTEPQLLTSGGPGAATLAPGLLVYRTGLIYGRFGEAAALGLITGAIAAVAGLLLVRIMKERT